MHRGPCTVRAAREACEPCPGHDVPATAKLTTLRSVPVVRRSGKIHVSARARSKLALETGLEEGVHILRTLHNDGLLVVIGKDEEALLLYRLDDDFPDLVRCH